MNLESFIAARVGTRFVAVTATGRLGTDDRRRGASRAISVKTFAALRQAYERGEEPGDKLTQCDLRLLAALASSNGSKQIEVGARVNFFFDRWWRAVTVKRTRLRKWITCGLVEPMQAALFADIPARYALTPKGEKIGKAAASHGA
jgi:hypothetical protein